MAQNPDPFLVRKGAVGVTQAVLAGADGERYVNLGHWQVQNGMACVPESEIDNLIACLQQYQANWLDKHSSD